MVKETQLPYTDLQFPTDAVVGDFWKAPTRFTYELMPNLRWRNVLPNPDDNIGDPNLGTWVRDTTPLGAEKFMPVPTGGDSIFKGGLIPFYPSTTLQHNQLIYRTSVGFDAFLPVYGEICSATPFPSSRALNIDFLDPVTPLYPPMPKFPVADWEMWIPGQNISALNHYEVLMVTFNLADYVEDLARMNEVTVEVEWVNSNGAAITGNRHYAEMNSYANANANKNYIGRGDTRLTIWAANYSYPVNSPNLPERFLTTGPQLMNANSRYVQFNVEVAAGQRVGDFRLNIVDPSAVGGAGVRNFSGFHMIQSGDLVIASRNNEVGALIDFSLPLSHDLEDYVVNDVTEVFHDYDAYPDEELVNPSGGWISSNGRNLVLCDVEQGTVKQWKLRYDRDFSTIQEINIYQNWDYGDYYHEFTTVNPALDAKINRDFNTLFVLEDDNVIRRYTFTGQDISTAVYQDEVDVTPATASATCFCLSFAESAVLVPYDGGMRHALFDTTLSSSVWQEPTLLDIVDPVGIHINSDNTKIFVGEKPADEEREQGIIQMRRIVV